MNRRGRKIAELATGLFTLFVFLVWLSAVGLAIFVVQHFIVKFW